MSFPKIGSFSATSLGHLTTRYNIKSNPWTGLKVLRKDDHLRLMLDVVTANFQKVSLVLFAKVRNSMAIKLARDMKIKSFQQRERELWIWRSRFVNMNKNKQKEAIQLFQLQPPKRPSMLMARRLICPITPYYKTQLEAAKRYSKSLAKRSLSMCSLTFGKKEIVPSIWSSKASKHLSKKKVVNKLSTSSSNNTPTSRKTSKSSKNFCKSISNWPPANNHYSSSMAKPSCSHLFWISILILDLKLNLVKHISNS